MVVSKIILIFITNPKTPIIMQVSKELILDTYGKQQLNLLTLNEVKHILPQLLAFVGKKIFTLKGKAKTFNISFTGLQPQPVVKGDTATLHLCYLTEGYNNLILKMKICLNGGSYEKRTYYCQYFEQEINLGEVKNSVLVSVKNLEDIIKTYELDEIVSIDEEIEKIKKYKELSDQLNEVKRSIKIPENIYKYM